MKFRAVRPSQVGKVDAIIVPLFNGAEPPTWLSRPARAAIARLVKQERGVTRLYGVNTLHEEPRVIVVGAGKRDELDFERARNIASAGVRALWRASVRKVAIAIAADPLGEERAAQAAVEGAIYAMWRPGPRTREEERSILAIAGVFVTAGGLRARSIGTAIGEATNACAGRPKEPANRLDADLTADSASLARKP